MYCDKLRNMIDWDDFLLENSGLPGPRGNLELMMAVVQEGDKELFDRYLAYSEPLAPRNSPGEFLAMCGTVGYGRLIAEGHHQFLPILRISASDGRWRVREAAAIAYQIIGEHDFKMLLNEAIILKEGNPMEKRAAAAAICEPKLLKNANDADRVLKIMDDLTEWLADNVHLRKTDEYQVLRKGLAYGWSVVVAAFPREGKPSLEKWLENSSPDIRWVMKENLKKKRLLKIDPLWVEKCSEKLNDKWSNINEKK